MVTHLPLRPRMLPARKSMMTFLPPWSQNISARASRVSELMTGAAFQTAWDWIFSKVGVYEWSGKHLLSFYEVFAMIEVVSPN